MRLFMYGDWKYQWDSFLLSVWTSGDLLQSFAVKTEVKPWTVHEVFVSRPKSEWYKCLYAGPDENVASAILLRAKKSYPFPKYWVSQRHYLTLPEQFDVIYDGQVKIVSSSDPPPGYLALIAHGSPAWGSTEIAHETAQRLDMMLIRDRDFDVIVGAWRFNSVGDVVAFTDRKRKVVDKRGRITRNRLSKRDTVESYVVFELESARKGIVRNVCDRRVWIRR